MHATRRSTLGLFALAALASACLALPAQAHKDDDDGFRSGMVFTSSNAATGNQLLVYARERDGTLSLHATVATGGAGSGAGLGSQGAVTLSRDGRFVFVVNAGANTVSTFELKGRELKLASVVDSGGLHPISVTENDDIVVVLNDGGSGGVAGFRNNKGVLQRIAASSGALSVNTGAAPAQVGFSTDGDSLVVTEKGTNKLTAWKVAKDGRLSARTVTSAPGVTPFGFAFDGRDRLVVSEAWGGAAGASTVSSYRFSDAQAEQPIVVTPALANGQGAACWVSISPNSKWAYISNTGSSTVSLYSLAGNGRLTLQAAVAGSTGVGSTPADSAVSADGRRLFVRSGGTLTISSFEIQHDGSLGAAIFTTGLPARAVGLAAN